ncbi:unnamed protein product, partial [Ixodes hexagonus]
TALAGPASADVSLGVLRGPFFTLEPPSWVEFSNSSGAEVRCEAGGDPRPMLLWISGDGSPVSSVPGLRELSGDGALAFPAFAADAYRQDVHAAVYRCLASNRVGAVASRDVHVSAVVDYMYEPRVHDGFVIRGNTAVLKCHVPSYIRQHTVVDAWIRDDGFTINASGNKEDHFSLLETGELLVHKTTAEDADRSYRCRTRHRLTGHLTASSVAGRVTVADAHAMTHVKMVLSFPEVRTAVGSQVDLPCVAQGYPPPHYSWYKEEAGRRLSVVESDRVQSSNGVLSIRAVSVHDGGRYVCVARNSVGEQKVETLLSVAVLLSAEISPAFQTVAMGLPAVFNCSVEGQPVHSITWRKNGSPLVPDGRIQLLSQNQMRIQTVRRDDAGMYQCVAQNDMDSCQAAAQLSLDDISPTLVDTFKPQVVNRGDPVSLLCRSRGSPAPELTWAIDGDFLYPSHRLKIGAERGSLEVRSLLNISEARHEDSGEYSCVARNDIATVAHSARLEVYGPPFVRPLRNITVVSGTELTLRCPYGGFPIDSLTWQKGGLVLPVNFRQTVDSRGRLHVRQAQKLEDEGEYSCIVTGSSGHVASGSTYVSVVVAPVIDDHFFPDVIKVEEGTRSRLMCSVSKGDPPLRFRWLKNGLTIGSHGDRSIEATDDSSIIKFARVRFVDRGSYVCFVSNDAASVNRTVQLVVHVSPKWKTEPQNVSVVLGASVFLHCASDGFPSPAITWKKGQGSAPRNFSYIHYNFRKHHFSNGSLLVREVEETDQGFYLCEAHNGIGPGISKLVFLKAHVPPRFEVKHRSFLLKKGEDFCAQCLAVGDAPLLYSWEKNQNPLDAERYRVKKEQKKGGSFESDLLISRATREDSGVFSCKAENRHGEDTTHFQVIVQEPPDSPSDVKVTNFTSRSATLQWHTPYNGNSPITRYVLQHKLQKESWSGPVSTLVVTGSDTVATVRGLQPVTTYALRIVAENALGPGTPSNESLVTTKEEAPTGTPSGVTVQTTGSQSLKVSWKAPSKEHRHGTILGYRVGYRVAHSDDSFQFKQVEARAGNTEEKSSPGADLFLETTYLSNLQRLTKYGIVVQAFNGAGTGPASDEVIATTLETAPPTSPSVRAVPLSSSSLSVQWERDPKDNTTRSLPTEYVLHYGTESGDWLQLPLNGSKQSLVLNGLKCGTLYRLYMTASNSLGTGEPGTAVSVRTKGAAPISPTTSKFITANSTTATLHLNAWSTGGCPVTRFAIQYRLKFHPTWLSLADFVDPRRRQYQLSDLLPSRQYQVNVIAHSEAGVTQADFEFHTPALSAAG